MLDKKLEVKNRKVSLYELGLGSIVVGAIGSIMFGMPLAGLLFNGIGIGCCIGGVFEGKGKQYDKLWENTGLYVGDKDTREYPRVKEIKETSYGESIRIKPPIGISSEDFKKESVAIKEHFKAENIEVTFNSGFIFLQLHRGKLPKECEYEAIETKGRLEVPIGRSVTGIETIDLAKAPHTMIAGETGGGKSTVLRAIITYLIQYKSVVLHLVDLKGGVEFNVFRKSEKVETFARSVSEALKLFTKLEQEVNRRYDLFFKHEVVNIEEYNKKVKVKLNYQIAIIDEFVDLADSDCIEPLITLGSKARACGIHLIISTQRCCAKTIDTRLRAHFPYVIGLKTKDMTNSKIILDYGGLENLRGEGHSILKTIGMTEIQCFNISVDQARQLIKSTYKEEIATFETREKAIISNMLEVVEGGKVSGKTKGKR